MPSDWLPAIVTTIAIILLGGAVRAIDWYRHRELDQAELRVKRSEAEVNYASLAEKAYEQVQSLAGRLTELEAQLGERDQTIARQAVQISKQADQISELEAESARLKIEVARLKVELAKATPTGTTITTIVTPQTGDAS